MIQRRVLVEVIDALEVLGIPYMLVGSFASNYWGRPRTTHDADLVVELPVRAAEDLARSLATSFYVDAEAVREAVRRRGQFNVIHLMEAFKVDLWLLHTDAFDQERFRRRRRATLFGRPTWITTAEDLILAKLLWYQTAPTLERQFQDALEVFEIQRPSLDEGYLHRWASSLGLQDLLGRICLEALNPPEQPSGSG